MKKQKNAPQILPREEWPYEVPENWVWTVAKNTVNLYRGVSYKKNDAHTDKHSNDYLILRGGNISEGKIDTFADNIYVNKDLVQENQLVKNNDIVIVASTGSKTVIGRSGISYNDYTDVAFGAFLILLRPKEMLCKPYIAYFYQSLYYRESIRNLAAGVNINNIRANHILEMPVPLPPLPEQQRIVARIESLFAKLDAAAKKIRATIDAFPTRKAALLHKAFTGELTKKWREEHGVGMESWKETLLKEQTSSIGDGLHGTPIYDEAGEYYFVNGNNLNTTHIEIKNDTKRVNEKEYNKYRVQLSSNTILLSINGTLGNTAFYQDEPIILGKSACYINILPTISKYFLRYYFCSWEFRDYANAKSTGSTIKNLGLKAIRELPIFLPTLPEQQEIVRRLDAILAREQSAKETAEQLLDTIALTKKSILARAFRGLLGTNNPKEASAEGLLKDSKEVTNYVTDT